MPPSPERMNVALTEAIDLKNFREVTRPPPPFPENLTDGVKGEHQENTLEPACGFLSPSEELVGQRSHCDRRQSQQMFRKVTQRIFHGSGTAL